MTIMVAGGLTFAIPGVMPEAMAANANLYVSAENSQYANTMSGPQVVEVVVIDSDINETNESNGEPDVTVNGKKLRMAQATDGNWYGYFADKTQATTADQINEDNTINAGYGLDFGQFCGQLSTTLSSDETTQLFSDTVGVALPIRSNGANFGVNGTATITSCTTDFNSNAVVSANSTHINDAAVSGAAGTVSTGVEKTVQNVVREAKKINTITTHGNGIGQISLKDDGLWPFIQLYDLTDGGNVNITYNKGGGVQSTSLVFEAYEDVTEMLDRAKYPQGAQVHFTVNDPWLNIDPTDEDSWSFDTSASGYEIRYQVYDENGAASGDGTTDASQAGGAAASTSPNINASLSTLMADEGVLKLNTNAQGAATIPITLQDNGDVAYTSCTTAALCVAGSAYTAGDQPLTLVETNPNSGAFVITDESDVSQLKITSGALRGTSATLSYADDHTILVGNSFGTIDIVAQDDEWSSGEEIPVVLVDEDQNKNSYSDEDLTVATYTNSTLIPALTTGDPFTLGENSTSANVANYQVVFADFAPRGAAGAALGPYASMADIVTTSETVSRFSQIGLADPTSDAGDDGVDTIVIDYELKVSDLLDSIKDTRSTTTGRLLGENLLNLAVGGFNATGTFDVYLLNSSSQILNPDDSLGATVGVLQIANDVEPTSITSINGTVDGYSLPARIFDNSITPRSNYVGLAIVSNNAASTNVVLDADAAIPFAADFFSFGYTDDGAQASERVANQIVRIEVEETGDNTSTFEGSLEFVMVNQLNIYRTATYTDLSPTADDPSFVVIEDLTDEDAPRVNYFDLGADGVSTQIADQEEAPTHSGVVTLDSDSYKVADTVTVTLEDSDLNTDSELIDIFTVVKSGVSTYDAVGGLNDNSADLPTHDWGALGRLLDVTFDDEQWKKSDQGTVTCVGGNAVDSTVDDGLGATNFALIESGISTGVFVGDFQIPSEYCKRTGFTGTNGVATSTTGVDIEVNYVDFRDASGEIIEVGDGAGVRANTGSVSLDRTVYPVPFGVVADFDTNTSSQPSGRSLFPIHQSGVAASTTLAAGEFLANGDLTIHVRVNDPDFDLSASGEDTIASNSTAGVGPVKLSVIRGSSSVILGHAGGPDALDGTINTGSGNINSTRQFGPITEIAPDAGVFEIDVTLRYTDGPASTTCPTTNNFTPIDGSVDAGNSAVTTRFDTAAASGNYCILQGDILQVEYTDPTDASGDANTVTDSATFDLRNGVLQSDKSVYIIGSDMILTLIEPDFDLDNDAAETYDLDLIEWDSDAFTDTIGDKGGYGSSFDPEPSDFRETGDSTGIFQVVLEIPASINNDNLERGEEIVLEYSDWGPSGSDYVGDEDEDVNLTIYTSNFGATVELDQKVYTWTDKVYITIVAPDHNFDSNLVDEIGNTSTDPIKVSTRGYNIDQYKLVETGTDTGIFTGEVILTGFTHDADGDSSTGTSGNDVVTGSATGSGPTDGQIPTDDDDGLTVSFEFSEDETVVGSALIRWNIGEVQWLEASYPASGTGVVRVIDPDMNLDPEAVDNFDVDVWSDSDAGGIDLTVTETNEATGIFEGTVFFTTLDESSGHRLRVSEGDTVTAEYEDNTLPDPYTTADELDITATSLIGTVVPPLERAPAANLRTVDAFGNSLDSVSVDQQVQISADLANGQDREQSFAYLVQIQDGNGVTVSLAWITGSLSAGQSFSPALSWIPTDAGTYTATAFVWESVDNPTALSPPVSTTVNVS
jgi:hypothetical protein